MWVDPEKMRAYDVAVADVAKALKEQNVELPAGSVNAGEKEFSVRTLGRLVDPAQFDEIAVVRRGTYVVKIRDIGHAEDSEEEPTTAARLNGNPAVTLVVAKQSGENTVATADGVKARLKEIQATLPKDLTIQIINDQSTFIKSAVHSLEAHLVEGSILAAIIIYIFLANIRTTLISAVAIPTSIISAFGLMAAMNLDLNQITMLALTLMVGIVIDDAIIVLENIYRYMEEKGMPPMQAAIEGTKEIGLAVMATTLSLLAVFLPIGFMGGITGRFMSSFGFTASFAIAVSLLVSFTLTPMLSSRFIKMPPRKEGGSHHSSKDSKFFRFLDQHYTQMLEWAMAHRKSMVALCVVVSLCTIPLFMLVGKNFVAGGRPQRIPGHSQSSRRYFARRDAHHRRAHRPRSARATRRDGHADFHRFVAGRLRDAGIGREPRDHLLELVPVNQRSYTQEQMMSRARELMKAYPSGDPHRRTCKRAAAAADKPTCNT